MFYSRERQAKIANDKIKDKSVVKTRGDAKGVTLGFNTSERPEPTEPLDPDTEFDSGDLKREEILFRKFK